MIINGNYLTNCFYEKDSEKEKAVKLAMQYGREKLFVLVNPKNYRDARAGYAKVHAHFNFEKTCKAISEQADCESVSAAVLTQIAKLIIVTGSRVDPQTRGDYTCVPCENFGLVW